MTKKIIKTNLVIASLVIIAVLFHCSLINAGSLEPPGNPNPTMKTLDEVEPRIPISKSDIPLTISTSGSYYFTEDVNRSGDAIIVSVDDVTIDLMGYTLKGSESGYGINILDRHNIEIRNGTIRDFQYGIYNGSTPGGEREIRVIGIRAISNARIGIYLSGGQQLVKNCMVSENGYSASVAAGIIVGSDSVITGNTVYGNGGSCTGLVYGIKADKRCIVTENAVSKNGQSVTASGQVYGIEVGDGCRVSGNVSCDNGDSYAGSTTVYGIMLGDYCLVEQNTVYDNGSSASSVTQMDLSGTGCVYGNNVVAP